MPVVVTAIVEVPASKFKFVTVVAVQSPQVNVLVLNIKVLGLMPVMEKIPVVVTGWPLVLRTPAVKVMLAAPLFKAFCKVHPPPVPLKVITLAIVFPANDSVLPGADAPKVIAPV